MQSANAICASRHSGRRCCRSATVSAGEVLLEVRDLEAKVAETGNEILRGVNLTIREGEVRACINHDSLSYQCLAWPPVRWCNA